MTWQPVVAFLLGGALGFAGGKISPRWLKEKPPKDWAIYTLAVVNGLLTALLALQHPLTSAYFWHHLLFMAILSTASFTDLHERIIPNELVLFGLAAGALVLLVSPYPEKGWLQALYGGAAGFGFLLLLALLVPGGMGFGDVKLSAVLGLFVGLNYVPMGMMFSFILGGLVSAFLLLLRSVGRKQHIPFGPFLAVGHIITVLYGWDIWVWYINRL